MAGPEFYQLCQLRLGETPPKRLTLDQLSLALKTLGGTPCCIVYFPGKSGMGLWVSKFRGFMEKQNPQREVRVIHYQQLLFHGEDFGNQPFPGYSESPLGIVLTKPCVTIVEDFEEFDEQRLNEVLGRIEQTSSSINWILLVPTWKSMRPLVEEMALNKSFPRFYFDSWE